MKDDREKWNRRYGGSALLHGSSPSGFLEERIDLISALVPGKRALDIACGEGRNSIFLARRGFSVTGIDISEEGLAKAELRAGAEGVEIEFRCIDLESYCFTESYDLVLDFNFLLRPLIPEMVNALNPGGVIVFDSILDTPSLEGFHNREFLLKRGELRAIFSRFSGEVVLYDELPDGPMPTARLIYHDTGPHTP